MKFIDTHCHLIFDVDDGSKSMEESLKQINLAKSLGVTDIITTPHSKNGDETRMLKVKENFKLLKKEAKKIGVNLYLGNEIMFSSKMLDLLKQNKLLTLNNTKSVLFELKRKEDMPISSIITVIEDLVDNGYVPILAHPEQYDNYLSIDNIRKFKEAGAYLQVSLNDLFFKNTKYKKYKAAKKMLKYRLVDIIASDNHCSDFRNYDNLEKAYLMIKRKYKEEYANIIFYENPKIIGGINNE